MVQVVMPRSNPAVIHFLVQVGELGHAVGLVHLHTVEGLGVLTVDLTQQWHRLQCRLEYRLIVVYKTHKNDNVLLLVSPFKTSATNQNNKDDVSLFKFLKK